MMSPHAVMRLSARPSGSRRTGNLRAVQLLLGHSKIESTVRYLGIEVDDAIEIAEKIDIKRQQLTKIAVVDGAAQPREVELHVYPSTPLVGEPRLHWPTVPRS